MPRIGFQWTKEFLEECLSKWETAPRIAKELNCHPQTVRRYLRDYALNTKRGPKPSTVRSSEAKFRTWLRAYYEPDSDGNDGNQSRDGCRNTSIETNENRGTVSKTGQDIQTSEYSTNDREDIERCDGSLRRDNTGSGSGLSASTAGADSEVVDTSTALRVAILQSSGDGLRCSNGTRRRLPTSITALSRLSGVSTHAIRNYLYRVRRKTRAFLGSKPWTAERVVVWTDIGGAKIPDVAFDRVVPYIGQSGTIKFHIRLLDSSVRVFKYRRQELEELYK